jgi:outer membrane protein TolC
MIESRKRKSVVPRKWWYSTLAMFGSLVLGGVLAAQDRPSSVSAPVPLMPLAPGARLKTQFTPAYDGKAGKPEQAIASSALAIPAAYSESEIARSGARLITLQEAQQKATTPAANNPMVRLGQLQVEMARQTRLGTISTFFPQIGSDFSNFHFNKFMGQRLEIARPIQGGSATVGVPLVGKDQTLVAVTATQPITPLFQLHELYKINLADENIARAKAGMPVSETASNVERAYYGLLVAQRQLVLANVNATETANEWLVAGSPASAVASPGHDEELIEASNTLAIATTKVKELNASLNEMLGWPLDTELHLVTPDPGFADISLKEATDKAMAANPEVIEAEQNVIKARAASTIQKLAYVPVVAAMGGYAYNANVLPLLPRDFSFIGLVATYNLFDFGKREHTIKGAKAQAEMAEIALQLTKAKVAGAVKTSHLELERLRQLSELTGRLDSAIQLERTSYEKAGAEVAAGKQAKVEAEMFQADLDYRQALARMKTLMGEQ